MRCHDLENENRDLKAEIEKYKKFLIDYNLLIQPEVVIQPKNSAFTTRAQLQIVVTGQMN